MEKDRNIRLRVMVGTISNYLGKLISLVTFFFLTPFILRRLGDATYGLWVLVGSSVGYGSLLDLGIWGAIIKYVAEHRARGENRQTAQVVISAFYLYCLLGLIVAGLSLLAAPLAPKIFNVPPEHRTTTVHLVMLMGLGIGFSLPGMTPMSVLRGMQRYDIVNLIEIGATFFTAAGTVTVLLMGAGVYGVVIVNLCGILVISALGAWFLHRLAPELEFRTELARAHRIRDVLSFSWPLFVRDVSDKLKRKTDEITIGVFLPLLAIAPYNLAKKISELSYVLTKQFMKVLLPLASELNAEADVNRLRLVYTAGSRMALAISTGLGIVLIVLARPILTVWVGPGYADAAPLVVILTVATIFATSQWPAGAILQGMSRHRILAITGLGAGIANLLLSIALTGPFGLTGVALGTLIPAVVEFAVVIPIAMSIIGVGSKSALKDVFFPALAPAALTLPALVGLEKLIEPVTLVSVAAIASAGVLVYCLGYLAVGASNIERAVYRGVVTSVYRLIRFHDWPSAGGLVERSFVPKEHETEGSGL